MAAIVRIYSNNLSELSSFLSSFFENSIFSLTNEIYWEKKYSNPVEIADIIAAFIDNNDKYSSCNMWVSIDKDTFINISHHNYNFFIKYLYERYPY